METPHIRHDQIGNDQVLGLAWLRGRRTSVTDGRRTGRDLTAIKMDDDQAACRFGTRGNPAFFHASNPP